LSGSKIREESKNEGNQRSFQSHHQKKHYVIQTVRSSAPAGRIGSRP
jgi:hypothetical protein